MLVRNLGEGKRRFAGAPREHDAFHTVLWYNSGDIRYPLSAICYPCLGGRVRAQAGPASERLHRRRGPLIAESG